MHVSKAISSVFLAFLTLASSTSFMVGMHICSGETKNVALFTKAEACEKEKSLPPCHRHETPDCCQDETVLHEGDDVRYASTQLQIPAPGSVIEQPLVLITEVIPSISVERPRYFNYDPPLRACDLTVEHRVFLI